MEGLVTHCRKQRIASIGGCQAKAFAAKAGPSDQKGIAATVFLIATPSVYATTRSLGAEFFR